MRSNGYQGELSWPLNIPLVLKTSPLPIYLQASSCSGTGSPLRDTILHSWPSPALSDVAKATHPVAFLPSSTLPEGRAHVCSRYCSGSCH